MNKSGAFRNKKVNFTQVSNNVLRQQSGLTLKARGLFGLIQSYITIPNFTLYKATLRKECVEGKKSFESAWKELKDKGFLLQYRLQDDKGCFFYEYELLDEPNLEVVEQQQTAIENKQKEEIIHTPKKEVMDKVCDGKGGIYTNTNPINTDLTNTYSNNKKKNEERKPNKGYAAIIANYTDNEILRETIYAFIEMRKANHSIITDKGLEKLLAKLDKFTEDVLVKIDILNNSVIKSYRDIFPLQEVIVPKKDTNTNYKSNNNNTKDLKFNNFDQRTYDYDTLEKKLLGWDQD